MVAITLPILLISLSWADDRSPQPVRPQLKRPAAYDGKTIEEWVAILRGGNSFQRERAARLLAYSPADKAAIEQLCHAIHDEDEQVAQSAMWAIDRLGPDAADAVPTLIKALKDQDEGMRINAASAIGQIGRGAAAAVPALVAALKDDCEHVRGNTACALRNIGLRTPAVTDALVKALDDKSDAVRSNAAWTLWKLSKTERAISVLEETIKNGSALGRSVAAGGLAAIGTDAKTAAPALRTVLQSQRGSSFAPSVAFALWKTSHDPLGISALAEMLDENQLAPYAATHLGDIGPSAKSAVPALGRAMRGQDRFVAVHAARALWLVEKQDLALSKLCGWLKKEDSLTRHYCCRFLADVGRCPRSVSALKNALDDRDDYVRWTAREVLRKWNID